MHDAPRHHTEGPEPSGGSPTEAAHDDLVGDSLVGAVAPVRAPVGAPVGRAVPLASLQWAVASMGLLALTVVVPDGLTGAFWLATQLTGLVALVHAGLLSRQRTGQPELASTWNTVALSAAAISALTLGASWLVPALRALL